MPLKISGRHYGENLARVDLLFSSLVHYGAADLLDELIVVVRGDEADAIGRHLGAWPELPLRVVVEDEHFPAFRRYRRAWQVRPWQRQQIIKLNSVALTTASYVLTLDPDVLARRPLTRGVLLPGGRALLEPEPRAVHQRWWLDSADLLEVDPGLERPGMSVTPALLSTAVLGEVHRRIESVASRPWMDVLLTSYCDWTEYTLYLLAAERAGLVGRHHIWPNGTDAAAHLHVEPSISIWDAGAASRSSLDWLFETDDPGLFAIVQSSSGQSAADVAAVAAARFPVRTASTTGPSPGGAAGTSKLRERANTASRLAATRMYRMRRRVRRAIRARVRRPSSAR